MKTILITGGAGFIGSNFIHYILEKYPGYKIINYDALTYAGNLKNLSDIQSNPNYSFVKGHIADTQRIEIIFMRGIDYVINFAAETHVDRSIQDSESFVVTNVLGVQTLLGLSKKYGVKKYLQVSTDEVYGSLSDEGFFTEKTPLCPNNPYSASKAAADLLTLAYYKTYKFPVNITRCSNNYGPNQYPEKLMPLVILKAMNEDAIPIYGNGLNIRDWIHVEDHCRGIDLVLHNGKIGEVYNIGGNNEIDNLTIVKNILHIMSKNESLIQHVEDRLGHDYRYAIDASKIKEELGFKSEINFSVGLKSTINWYIKNASWFFKQLI
ncbi:MAG: dTDP-glucose 4,6-dehydratase [Firmicutes bacterium HGW-Firmicutes-1]|nr:MAG: dTDP-glucose 4,6-dehydratase [Firmicutes bacterium HGW-Firmicutes-1]